MNFITHDEWRVEDVQWLKHSIFNYMFCISEANNFEIVSERGIKKTKVKDHIRHTIRGSEMYCNKFFWNIQRIGEIKKNNRLYGLNRFKPKKGKKWVAPECRFFLLLTSQIISFHSNWIVRNSNMWYQIQFYWNKSLA